jgi:hypothetical protein
MNTVRTEATVGQCVTAAPDLRPFVPRCKPRHATVSAGETNLDAWVTRPATPPDEGELAPDRYLLQLWPAPAAPDEIEKETSAVAGYWHRVARGDA